ncbi:MAG: hypothetical protein KF732_05415 [Flavobacteriales bacterium]|nr:hypothetical protein [Flavobacteriales bacterium]
MDFLKKFLSLKSGEIYSMNRIEWWLLKYADFYKETCQNLLELEDAPIVRLPQFIETTENDKFLNLYKALETISDFHRNEDYFELQMIDYQKIKHSKTDLRNWVAKNEKLVADKYVCFLIDYLDYSANAEHLNVFVHTLKEIDVYIDRQDFKNTIEFLEIFNELYWVQEILPESIKR